MIFTNFKMKKILYIPLFFILIGCETTNDGLPAVRIIVDQAGIDINTYNNDLFECRQYAGQIDAGSDALSGALAGAIVGALVGAAIDDSDTAKRTGAKIRGPIPLPTRNEKFTVNKSPHVDKKSRDQYEIRTHKRLMDIYSSSSKTIDALMKLELPSGVHVEIKVI